MKEQNIGQFYKGEWLVNFPEDVEGVRVGPIFSVNTIF